MGLKGIIPPIGTPVADDERVDEMGLRNLVRYLIEGGVHGIFANGTMGCFALLSDLEQMRLIDIVVDETQGRVPVIAGVSDTGTKRVLTKVKEVEKLKVDYVTAVPPYYYKLTQEQGKGFFRDVAAASGVPVFVYNNPYLTKLDLDIKSIAELADEPNIVGLKETSQDCNRWTDLFEELGNREFDLFFGTELLMPQCLMMGADGVIGGAHNMAPRIAVELYDAVCARDFDIALARSRTLKKLCGVFQYGDIWGGFEAALQLLGICDKTTLEPYSSCNAEDRDKVREILVELGLLSSGGQARGQAE
ncbi:MAG: dihydrodipicolinate synthase family protein [Pyrinomonadaceae bacterium]